MTDNPENLRKYESETVVSYYEHYTRLEPCEKFLFDKYVSRDATVLDIGVGAGRTTPALSRLGARYVGADYSSAMIGSCRNRFPGLDFRVCDATDLQGFSDEEFDVVVFSFNGIDVISTDEARGRCFSEVGRVLKRGGVFIFSSHNAKLLGVYPDYTDARPHQVVWRSLRAVGKSVETLVRSLSSKTFYNGRGYVRDPVHGGMDHYVSTPKVIAREVAGAGLKLEEVVGGQFPSVNNQYLSAWHYYVCRKPQSSNAADGILRG